jgi:hypothetical protein
MISADLSFWSSLSLWPVIATSPRAGNEEGRVAHVARIKDGEVITTDGPFAETKEFLGGIYIILAPDLGAALAWGGKIARATTLPIEVRPFQDRKET